jgi:serine/threonine protein kinase
LQLVEKLATYEQRAHDEMRGSGGNALGLERPSMASDLMSKLRRKLEKSQKKKDAMEVLHATEEMDAEFWSPKSAKRKVKLDMEKMEILHPLTKDVGGSLCRLHVCEIDGFVCVMKELDIAFAKELNASLVRTFESEVVFLEQLPAHPNIVRYLFHTFDHETGRARLFMTKYAMSLRDEIVRRKAGVGDVTSGVSWCGCCPKCAVVEHAPGDSPPAPLYLNLVEAARILLDIAQGLYFLHFHSVLHRDLKSDNIFVKLGPDGQMSRLLIGDFDTAKSLKDLNNRSSTAGTPGYIPPEVWSREDGQVSFSFAADVYSFGVIIFEVLSFRRPFEGLRGLAIQAEMADAKKTYADLVRDFSKAQLDAYHPLLQLFSQCCAIEPGERPTVSFVIMSLKNILAQAGLVSPRSPNSVGRPRAHSAFK